VVGDAAERRALTDPDRVVREFKRRLGDDIPLVVGGEPYGAHEVTALMVRWVVDRVTEREGGPPEQITLTLPASWGPHRKELLGQGLEKVGLEDVAFLTEPEAAAFSYAAQERVKPNTTIAVYDLGGGTFDAAVVRKTEADHFDVLGTPEGVERLGGVDFDDAVLAHVEAGVGSAMAGLDPSDPDAMAAMARLRRDCTEAKEALSSDTEVIIPVMLPDARTQVRLVRAEFEAMIRPAVEDSIESLRRAMRSAAVEPGDLDAVLLVGGSSRVPLVSQLVSADLGRAASIDADPKTTIAAGAALSAASVAGIASPAAEPVGDDAEPATALIPVGTMSAPDTATRGPVAPGPGSGASGRPVGDSESWETPPARADLWRSRKAKGFAAAGLLAAAVIGTATLVPYSLAGNLAFGNDSESGPAGAVAGPVAGDTAKSSLGGASSAVGRGPEPGSATNADASTSTTRGTGAAASTTAGAPAPAASGGRGGGPAVPLAAAPPAPGGSAPGGTPPGGGEPGGGTPPGGGEPGGGTPPGGGEPGGGTPPGGPSLEETSPPPPASPSEPVSAT
jgi:actin-like ATPase involved in cell morphogenesis